MAEKSSKCLHQSNSMSENAVKGIETSVTTNDCVLPEWSRCKVDSESIAPSWTVGCAVHVLNQSEKRKDDHNVRVRLRTKKSRAELMEISETVNPEHVHGEMGKLDPSKATDTSLDRTDEDGKRFPQRRTARKQWQQNAFTNLTMTENRKKYISKSLIQRYGETPGCSECLGASSRHTSGQRKSLDLAAQFQAVQCIRQSAGRKGRRIIRCFRQQRELMRFTLRYPRSCRSCML